MIFARIVDVAQSTCPIRLRHVLSAGSLRASFYEVAAAGPRRLYERKQCGNR